MQIVILGMHRSGTSAVTRLVNMMGAFVGEEAELIGKNDENPKGFWERADVIRINDALLSTHQCQWYDLSKWPLSGAEPYAAAPEAQDRQIRELVEQLDMHEHWVMKDPRLCQTYSYWRAHLKQPFVIAVYRDPLEIALSLKKRNGISIPAGLAIWESATVGLLNALGHQPHLTIHYKDVIEKPVETTQLIANTLIQAGATTLACPSEADILSFIEPSLYRNRADDTLRQSFTPSQHQLHDATGRPHSGAVYTLSASARLLMEASAPIIPLQESVSAKQEELQRALDMITRHEERLRDVLQERDDAHAKIRAEISRNGAMELKFSALEQQHGLLQSELEAIKNSRLWKWRNKLLGTE